MVHKLITHERKIKIARRYDKAESKRRILSACVKLFIERGYHGTTLSEILKEADVTSSTFQNIFHAKDGVLMELAAFMFDSQFGAARNLAGSDIPSVYVYAVETAIQLTIAELNENLREIYLEAYTQPEVAEYIYQQTSGELYKIFLPYLPNFSESDFYELEIGTSGIMRGYMARPCDKYFTLEKKLERFLRMSLGAYSVPAEEQDAVLEYIMKTDIRKTADYIMQELFKALAMKFEFTLTDEVKD